jgi:chromosome segregation ATPase
MNVSQTTEKALQDAMARLLAGGAHRTDGKLTKENLYREAGVSRATMNRARDVLTAWNHAVATHTGRPQAGDTSDELAELRTKLSRKTRECADLQQSLDAAATTIAALRHDNNALRDELARHRSSKVVVIA